MERLTRTDYVCLAWTVLAFTLTILWTSAKIDDGYYGKFSSVSAHFSVMAFNFYDYGLVDTRGTPIQEMPPFGESRDYYTHWPPLFPILLSTAFHLFGATDDTAQMLMMFILLVNGLLIFFILKRMASIQAASFGVMIYLGSPVLMKYGIFVLHIHLAITWTLIAVYGWLVSFCNKKIGFGVGLPATFLALWTSWEPFMVFCGFFVLALLWGTSQVRKTAAAFFAVACVGVVSVITFYFCMHSSLFQEFWEVFLFRIGMSNSYHAEGPNISPGLGDTLRQYVSFAKLLNDFGLLSIGAVLLFGLSRKREISQAPAAYVVFGFLTMWVGWYSLMRNHAYFHEYQILIALPSCSLCGGLVIHWVSRDGWGVFAGTERNLVAMVVLLLVPIFILKPLVTTTVSELSHDYGDSPVVKFLKVLRSKTEPGSIIMGNGNGFDMLSQFYSSRHYVSINEEAGIEKLESVASRIRDEYGGAVPLYLAIRLDRPASPERIESLSANFTSVFQSQEMLLFLVPPPSE